MQRNCDLQAYIRRVLCMHYDLQMAISKFTIFQDSVRINGEIWVTPSGCTDFAIWSFSVITCTQFYFCNFCLRQWCLLINWYFSLMNPDNCQPQTCVHFLPKYLECKIFVGLLLVPKQNFISIYNIVLLNRW